MQQRFHNYRRQLNSFAENQRFLGLITPGVYSGWDRIELRPSNVLRFHHDITGIASTATDNITVSDLKGCAVSRQGFFIYEDAPVDLAVEDNNGNSNTRIDLVIMHHQYLNSSGGQQATYSIVKGSLSSTIAPAIPVPALQIVIGELYIAPNATDHTNTIFKRFSTNTLGGVPAFTKKSSQDVHLVPAGYFNDFNRQVFSGIFHLSNPSNPPLETTSWSLLVMRNGNNIVQISNQITTGRTFTRVSVSGGTTWGSWVNLTNSDVSFDPSAILAMIGDLTYTEQNYVVDDQTLTDSVDALDIALGHMDGRVGTLEQELTTPETKISDHTLVLTDAGKGIRMNLAGVNNLTVPPNATVPFPIGTTILITQRGSGKTTIVPGSGVTINSEAGLLSIGAQHSGAVLWKVGVNEWDLLGNLIS